MSFCSSNKYSFIYRSLPQPLMTYDLHYKFIQAASKMFLQILVLLKYFVILAFPHQLQINNMRRGFINSAKCIVAPQLVIMWFHFKRDKNLKINWTAWFPILIAVSEQSLREGTKLLDLNCISELDQLTRVRVIHYLVHQLPEANFEMLDLLCKHLNK